MTEVSSEDAGKPGGKPPRLPWHKYPRALTVFIQENHPSVTVLFKAEGMIRFYTGTQNRHVPVAVRMTNAEETYVFTITEKRAIPTGTVNFAWISGNTCTLEMRSVVPIERPKRDRLVQGEPSDDG